MAATYPTGLCITIGARSLEHSEASNPCQQLWDQAAFIQMIQTSISFGGTTNEDPFAHLTNFLEICNTIKYNGMLTYSMWQILPLFSLRDKAKAWLNSLPPSSIVSWVVTAHMFISKYFLPSKTMKTRINATSFKMHSTESLYEA